MSPSRGNKTSKAHRAERQQKEIELMNEGQTQQEIASQLGISRQTFWRDIQELTKQYSIGNKESFAELRKVQVGALMDMAKEVHEGELSPEAGNSVRGFLDSVSKLLGLNAESRRVNVNVNATVEPEKMRLFDRFVFETRELGFADYEKIWAFCRELTAAKPPVVYGPPKDSPLWHDDEDDEDEPKQLTEGEPA